MKVIRNRIIPFGGYYAINLFGIVFAKGDCDDVTMRHEAIHTAQMRELLYLLFYIAYVVEWLVRFAILHDSRRAYHAVSFEREAYANQADAGYLSRRRHFAFFRNNRRAR